MRTTLEEPLQAFDFTLDRGAEVPIGVQLAWAIRTRIADERLAPGRRLPGSRELADALQLNANTVRAVYARLEQDGMIESRQGSGTFVTSAPPRRLPASGIAASAAAEARRSGVDPRDVAAALYTGADAREPAPDSETERRRVLRAQIVALQRAVDELQAEHPGLIEATQARDVSAARGPRLPDAAELEQVRHDLLRKLTALQEAIDALAQKASAPVESEKPPARNAAQAATSRKSPAKRGRPRSTSPRPAAEPT